MATATVTIKCPKCSGRKHISGFEHVSNGICFCCKGIGTIKCEDAKRELSADTRRKAEWIMASTPESYAGWSYSRLLNARDFSHGGWGITEAYPDLLSHWRKVGDPAFFAAQERKLAEMYN